MGTCVYCIKRGAIIPPNKLSRLVKQLNTDNWLERVIDECATFSSPERWSTPNVEIHPSGAGSPCPRDIQLGFLGHRTPMYSKNYRRMKNGTAAHSRWNEDLAETGVLIEHSVRHKIPGYWSGEADLIVENPITGTRHIGEIKTMNSFRFARVPAQDADFTKMASIMMAHEPGYMKQLAHYIIQFSSLDSRITDEAFFLFENTDTQDFVVRWVKPSPQLIKDVFKNPELARDASLRGEFLDPPFKRKSITCRRCYRESMCYALQDGDIDANNAVKAALATITNSNLGNLISIDDDMTRFLELDLD